MEENFDIEFVKAQIEDIYGTIVAFAKELGVTNQAIHSKLKKPSDKFIRQLERYGIMANRSQIGNHNHYSSDVNSDLIKVLKQLCKSQEDTIKTQREMITQQQRSLLEKNEIIANLERELIRLR